MSKVLTVEELIKNKAKIAKSDDKEINATLNVPSIGGQIKVSFTRNDIREFQEASSGYANLSEEEREEMLTQASYNLIYTVITEPNLKDKELQKAYECKEPHEIVTKIFTDGEMGDILSFLADKAGFTNGRVVEVEDLKN